MNIAQTVSLFKAMLEGPVTRYDLARKANTCPKSAGRFLTEMKAQKMIYVIDYTNESDGRNRVKVYTLGNGEDAKPKLTQSNEDRKRRSYLKKVRQQRALEVKTTFVGGKSLWQ